MFNKNKKYTNKDVYKASLITAILLICVIALGGFINYSDLQIKIIDEETANYISFNNSNTTDMIKVSNLSIMSDFRGASYRNRSTRNFKVLGEKNDVFKIVLYHIGTVIEEKYVHFALFYKGKEVATNTLNRMQETPNGGKIVYEGVISENEEWVIKMWVDHTYQEDVHNISYEIRIQ